MYQYLKVFIFIFLFPFESNAQDFPKDYFRAPVDFDMALAGTFGELRPNHFHSGIDIKTWGVQNKPLHAIADGFVSRISVSSGGFGNAVYIEHPNGYTSVYAHCNHFNDELAQWVRKEQYRQKSFQVNLFPERGQFHVTKGDIIAYSGNSGSSQGPHLHFEIRKTIGQIPVNPMLFGFDIKDYIRPKITGLRIYPAKPYSEINNEHQIYSPDLAGWGPEYRIKSNDTIELSGEFYFGLNTYDRLNDSKNHNGIYSISLFIDSVLVFDQQMDEFPFSESRYVNSLIDYSYYQNHHQRYQKTYIEPNNKLSIYDHVSDNGIFMFIDENFHTVKYVVKDAYQNESILTFTVKSRPPAFDEVFAAANQGSSDTIFHWNRDNHFKTDDIDVFIPEGALYDTMAFQYSKKNQPEGCYAPLHKVHNPGKSIRTWCRISLKPFGLPERLKDKAIIVNIDHDNMSSAGGQWENGFLVSRIREFGNYSITVDTLAPEINPVNIHDGKNISGQKNIKVKIKDDLTGIDHYEAMLNGQWLLMEWDPKNDLLTYRMDEHMKPGENDFTLTVKDGVGNQSTYQAKLTLK